MSTYQVQQCLFDHLRLLEGVDRDQPTPPISLVGYQLTAQERTQLVEGDVAELYRSGVHPVLINGFCRALGWKRADYRVLFPPDGAAVGGQPTGPVGRPRWQRS